MEEWQNMNADNNSENYSNRDGYRGGYNRENRHGYQRQGYQNNGGNGERTRRPRFNSNERVAYSSNGNSNERGFRPQGFGDNRRQGGYSSRPSHNQPRGFGYENNERPSFSNQHTTYVHNYRGGNQGGYRQGGGYNRQNGGYNNQEGYSQQRGGGYNQRPNNNRKGGYRPNGGNSGGGYDANAKYSMKKRIEYKEYIDDPNAPLRLNKFLANAGMCSRREADDFIQAGVVRVNGEVVTELGTKVQRTDTVHFHDQLVSIEKKVYVLLNKPKDYVTTSDDPQQRKTVMDLLKNCCRERIYPVGRLDRNTTGVLLFTNDGDLASKLTHPKYLKKKIYHVHLDKNVTAADLRQIAEGIMLEDGEIHADAISYASDTDKKQVGIEIHSGKNRIVRRIFESLGYKVMKLDRVMFAGLTKKGLKRGDWRFLTEKEVAYLHMGAYE